MQVSKSNKLANVCYDIRGPVLKHAKRLEEEGHRILKLNIGNPAPFGFEAPDEILQDVIRNLPTAQGYSDSKGLFSARKAVMQYYQQKQVEGVGIEDIYLGNKWNFTKFLIGRDGQVVKRFAPTTKPQDLTQEIEALLK